MSRGVGGIGMLGAINDARRHQRETLHTGRGEEMRRNGNAAENLAQATRVVGAGVQLEKRRRAPHNLLRRKRTRNLPGLQRDHRGYDTSQAQTRTTFAVSYRKPRLPL